MLNIFRRKAAAPMGAPANDQPPENAPPIALGSPPAAGDAAPDQLVPWPSTATGAVPKVYSAHPLADILPMIEGAEFDALVASIKRDDQLEPITLVGDLILDGRNRYRACLRAGVEPIFHQFASDDPSEMARFVASKNLARRHLSESQRAICAAELSKHGVTIDEASKQLAVSETSTKRARFVLVNAGDNVVSLVRRGHLSVHQAYEQAKQRTKGPTADRALARAFDLIEKALASGEPVGADVRRRAASIRAQLATLGRGVAA